MPWVVAAQADHPAVRRQPSNDRTCQSQQQSQQYPRHDSGPEEERDAVLEAIDAAHVERADQLNNRAAP